MCLILECDLQVIDPVLSKAYLQYDSSWIGCGGFLINVVTNGRSVWRNGAGGWDSGKVYITLHFPRKHRTCGDWARRRDATFLRRQASGPAGPGEDRRGNRPPVEPFACDRTEALIGLRVRKSNFHVSYRTDPG